MGTKKGDRPSKIGGSVSGSLLGLFVFLVGVGLLAFTFKLAFEMFSAPPQNALGIQKNQPLDLGQAGQSFIGVLIKILMLVVMGLVGSMIANRGVTLFSGSRAAPERKKAVDREDPAPGHGATKSTSSGE